MLRQVGSGFQRGERLAQAPEDWLHPKVLIHLYRGGSRGFADGEVNS